jgi:parvulin-like peptidyl-prolyl isomerase
MIEDKSIQLLARERGIRVSREEATQSVSRKLEEYGTSEEVKKDLERLYGWTLADFEEKIVIPSLYQQKLQASFEKEVDTTAAGKKTISSAQEALRASTSFADVAKKYSEGQTAKNGGALGWFTLEDLAQELRQPVASQKVGVPGDVIESGLGFHIVLVEEIRTEDQKKLYRLSQIFARKVTFADWLSEKMRELPIAVLSPEYRWNKAEARVEFKTQKLIDFEKEILKKSDGDAAFFF